MRSFRICIAALLLTTALFSARAASAGDSPPGLPETGPSNTPQSRTDALMGRTVVDPTGQILGKVQGVALSKAGEPTHVILALADKNVALPLNELNPDTGAALQTRRPAEEIVRLPPTGAVGAPY